MTKYRKGYFLFTRKENRAYLFTFDYEEAKRIAAKNNCYIEEMWVDF